MPIISQVVPDVGSIPLEARIAQATALQTALVNSKLSLFKDGEVAVTDFTTKAAFQAAECDFDGYTAGGLTIAAWGDPIVDGGAATVLLAAPSKQFNYVDDTTVPNDVGGWFLIDAAGNLRAAGEFDDPITMDDDLDGISLQVTLRI